MKKLFIIGIVILILGFAGGFLSGATNGADMQPILPIIYGTNQIYWAAAAFLGVILAVVGLIGIIIKAVKKSPQQMPPMQ